MGELQALIELIGAEPASHGIRGMRDHEKARGDYYRVCLLRLPHDPREYIPTVVFEVCHRTYHRCGPCAGWLRHIPAALLPYHTLQIQYIEAH